MPIPGISRSTKTGNLYIGTHGGSRIRKLDRKASIISTVVEAPAQYVASDAAGNLYVGTWPTTVPKWSEEGGLELVLEAGTYGSGATTTTIGLPGPVAFDSEGNVYLVDTEGSHRVFRLEP